MDWGEISPAVAGIVGVAGLMIAAVGTTAAILFGIWQMLRSAKVDNDKAHSDLGDEIKKVNGSVQGLTVAMTGVGKDVDYLRRDVDWYLRPSAPPPPAGPPPTGPPPTDDGPPTPAR